MNDCQNSVADGSKTVVCVFCNERIKRRSIREHLHHRTKRCNKVDALTLQLMTSVCEDYAYKHKPRCILCNEREWPYKGHWGEMKPVCESCHLSITSNTKMSVLEDAVVCAICGFYCCDKYILYWAGKIKSFSIGESCIEKLKNPKIKLSEETASLRAAKLKSSIKAALSSVTIHNISKNDSGIPRLTQNRKDDNSNTDFTEGCREILKTNNPKQSQKNVPIGQSFKIMNSCSSLPFTTLVPITSINTKEHELHMKNFSSSPGVTHMKFDFKQLKTQAVTESETSCGAVISFSKQGSWGEKESETKNTVPELQEKLPCVVNSNSFAQISYKGKRGEMANNASQISPIDVGFSDCRMYTKSTPDSHRSILPSVSSVKEASVASELCSHGSVSKETTGFGQSKYVIKYVSKPRNKPAEGIPHIIDRNYVIMKSSSNMPLRDETVKSPSVALEREKLFVQKSVVQNCHEFKRHKRN